ncbi:MAG: regulatory iron-sulfur-containing complex subunit RicT [Chloroflexota bacterium]
MATVVGVNFGPGRRVYYFDAGDIALQANDQVVAETAAGLDLGRVLLPPGRVGPEKAEAACGGLKPIARKATPEDIEKAKELRKKDAEAVKACRGLAAELKLPLKPVAAHYHLDGNVTISFTAPHRVDFRELVRQLGRRLNTAIKLEQIGVRDEARLTCGIGKCGRSFCCASFLGEFSPVSIKMAKSQNLSLDPMKISGVCGRLLCCLAYENEAYQATRRNMPAAGAEVSTSSGKGRVIGLNLMRETVTVRLADSDVPVEMAVRDVTWEKKEPAVAPAPAPPPGPAPTATPPPGPTS